MFIGTFLLLYLLQMISTNIIVWGKVMGCYKLDNGYYEGKIIEMTDKKHKKGKKILKEVLNIAYIVTSFSAVVVVIIFFVQMKEDINSIQEDMKEQAELIVNINENIVNIDNYLYDDGGVKDQLGDINEALNIKVINVTDEQAISMLDDINEKSDSISYTMPILLSNMPIGTDIYGNSYVVKDLVNQTVLLTYREDDKEVYFLGQYNDRRNWNGYCVTNSYNLDGTLYSICESNFDDGKRMDYKSLYSSAESEWTVSDRICDNNVNSGTTTNYYYEYETIKNFTNTNVRRTDILYVDSFIDNEVAIITKFYFGETLNQRYNDDSGDAYLVKYDSDGTVKTLYVGNFVDGYCEDYTGNAWSIVYSEELQDYFYNTGDFENNSAIEKSLEPITVEEIEKIVSEYNFLCDLKWKQN